MKIIFLFCLVLNTFAVYAGTIAKLEKELREIEEKIRTNPKPCWAKYLKDTEYEKNKRLRDNQHKKDIIIKQLNEEKTRRKQVTRVDIKVLGVSKVWADYGETSPDLYLKINGYKATEIKKDVKVDQEISFELSRRTFSYNNPLQIEIWDSDVKLDDHIHTIIVNGYDKSPMTVKNAGLECTVYWK